MEMPMPKVQDKEGCAFCQNTKVMPGYEDAATDSAHVIESLEGNPLVISNKHAKHFFDQGIEEQRDMIDAAIKVIKIYTQEKCSRFSLFSHVGIEGGQTFPHAHIHSLGSFFKRQ
jgi:diadenosine tetraphosphate (Ap4A) HIT family hydrolase